MQKLVHYMRVSVEEEAPRQFTRLVKVLRMLKMQELERLFEQLYKQQPETFTYEVLDYAIALTLHSKRTGVEEDQEPVRRRAGGCWHEGLR